MTLQDPAIIIAPIYLLGLATVTLSLLVAFSFMRESTKIEWSILKQSTLRLSMFLATSATTAHLYLTIRRLR